MLKKIRIKPTTKDNRKAIKALVAERFKKKLDIIYPLLV